MVNKRKSGETLGQKQAKKLLKYEKILEEGYSWTAADEAAFAEDLKHYQKVWRSGSFGGNGGVGWDELNTLLQNRNPLNPKQEAFIEYFLRYRNGHRAAMAAGYKDPVRAAGYMLYMHPVIKHEIERRVQLAQARHGMTTDRVLQELCNIAFANLTDFVEGEEDGEATITLKWADRDTMSALREITQETYVMPGETGSESNSRPVVKKMAIKFHDKLRALEHISKLLNLYPEDKPQDEGSRLAQTIIDTVKAMKEKEGL